MILTVDIGGTKTLCTFWDGHRRLEKKKYATRTISDFSVFLADQGRGKDITALCKNWANLLCYTILPWPPGR